MFGGRRSKKSATGAARPLRRTRFPSIHAVATSLRDVNRMEGPEDEEEGIEVRLQVYEDGGWAVRFGDPGYDTDHHGFWGSSSVPGNNKPFNATETARELISQAKDMEAEGA